MEQLQIQGH